MANGFALYTIERKQAQQASVYERDREDGRMTSLFSSPLPFSSFFPLSQSWLFLPVPMCGLIGFCLSQVRPLLSFLFKYTPLPPFAMVCMSMQVSCFYVLLLLLPSMPIHSFIHSVFFEMICNNNINNRC